MHESAEVLKKRFKCSYPFILKLASEAKIPFIWDKTEKGGRVKKWDVDAAIAAFSKLYKNGPEFKTADEIARKYGVTTQRIYRMTKDKGIKAEYALRNGRKITVFPIAAFKHIPIKRVELPREHKLSAHRLGFINKVKSGEIPPSPIVLSQQYALTHWEAGEILRQAGKGDILERL